MANISRSRSRSVSTAPFTRATGLSLTCRADPCAAVGDDGCGGVVFATATPVGAWEATWAQATETETKAQAKTASAIGSLVQIRYWCFIIPHLLKSSSYS